MLSLGPAQVFEKLMGADEIDPAPRSGWPGVRAQRPDATCPPWRPEEQNVGSLGGEAQRGQLFDLALVDGRLEAEVKIVECPLEGEVGHPRLGHETVLARGARLETQELREELRRGHRVVGGDCPNGFPAPRLPGPSLALQVGARLPSAIMLTSGGHGLVRRKEPLPRFDHEQLHRQRLPSTALA